MKLSLEEDMAKEFTQLLKSTNRYGIEILIDALGYYKFFEAPCSGSHHLARPQGLLEHSLNVYHMMERLYAEHLQDYVEIPKDSLIITGLLHDVGKCGDYGKPNYVPNILKDGKQSESKPYVTNSELLYLPHEVRSIAIIKKFIVPTEREEHAIYYHNGKYTHTGYDLKETPLQSLLHFADLWCSRFIEEE